MRQILDSTECRRQKTLIKASIEGHDKCVDTLIQGGADVDVQSKRGYTALMEAAKYGHEKCVGILIQAGADVNVQEPDYRNLIQCLYKWI